MLTIKELNSLEAFGKEKDGSYCDRWQFEIRKVNNAWCLNFFSEVDGKTWFIKKLKDLADLKNVYRAITNNDLQVEEVKLQNLVVAWFGVPGGKSGTRTHVCKNGKPICNTQLHKDAELQWCSAYPFAVECAHCKRIAEKMLK